MATRLTVRPAIVVVMMTAIMVAVVFFMISGGNGCSRCRTDGTAENSTVSATYLVADGSPDRATKTATYRGVGRVTRHGPQRGDTQR
ncbi:hypothetical protein [Marinobacter pelagius]|uniref:Uncharacterized protein n=1 Tax=Marinobacter pelagius TaxID=379482 RepID=A0A1I4V6G6_9GAMM|nr:hypothetical protein [Marinobacter pelagius]SFM96772.1 hypothetical protein SAMN04487961_1746 [Marinobacter pelagius]